jgi:hypothetical protein
MKMNAWLGAEIKIGNPEVGHFLDPRAGVVKKEQQGTVSVRVAPVCRQLGKQRADLIPIQKPRFLERCTLAGNRGYPLSNRNHLGDA